MLKTKPLLINIILTVLAIGFHFYLTQKFYALQNGTSSGESFCNVNALWNCDVVSTSSYAKVLGFPLALWGLVTNAVFLLVQSLAFLNPQKTSSLWGRTTAIGSVIIFLASVVMALISFTQLSNFCLFCVLTYALSTAGLVLIHLAGLQPLAFFQHVVQVVQDKTTWGLIVSVPVAVFVLSSAWAGPMTGSAAKGIVQDQISAWQAAPVQSFDLTSGLHLGAPVDQARMVIVEFADFRCPHCKFAAPTLKSFTQSRKDVALLFKPFPLDGTCNPSPAFEGRGDGISCRLALATYCAESLEKKGWDMAQSIFNGQDQFRQQSRMEDVDKMLCDTKVSSNCEDLKKCMSDDNSKVQIQKMAQEGIAAQIQGTPAFFINGKSLSGGQFLPVLEAADQLIR